MGPMVPGPMYGPMRGPPPPGGPMPPLSSMGPGGPGGPGPGPRPPWAPSSMSPYGGGSPGYVGPPPGGPGTPIMPSPGPGPGPDSDPLYMMKAAVPSSLPGGVEGPMGGGPPPTGDNGVNGDTLDNMKHSPATAPNTPRDGDPAMAEFNMSNFSQGGSSVSRGPDAPIRLTHFSFLQNESEAILKIKESMQEEAKRFEKDSEGGGGGGNGGGGGGGGSGGGGGGGGAGGGGGGGGGGQSEYFMP